MTAAAGNSSDGWGQEREGNTVVDGQVQSVHVVIECSFYIF